MPKLDEPAVPLSGALSSTAKSISIREVHTEAESNDLGLVAWTFEGRIPAKGNASALWKEAKEQKQLFRIETDDFGPPGGSWRFFLDADLSEADPPTHVDFWIAPVACDRPTHEKSERAFRRGAWSIRNGNTTLFNRHGTEAVHCVGLKDRWGFYEAIALPKIENAFSSSTFLTCYASMGIPASIYGGVRAPFDATERYLSNEKFADVHLDVKCDDDTSITIPAHRMILAACSDFFRSKFDFDERSGALPNPQISACRIETFTEPCIHAMLEFMYTQQIARHMPAKLDGKLQLISVCEYFQVFGMHEYITPTHPSAFLPDNVVEILGVGYKFRTMSEALAKGAGRYLKSNWNELGTKKGFSNSLIVDGLGELLKYALQGK